MPTPLARPLKEDANDYHELGGGKMLTPVLELESFNLGPGVLPGSASPRKRLDSASLSTLSHDSHGSQKSNTEGYDFSAALRAPIILVVQTLIAGSFDSLLL